jgi:RNA polymerase sigma-B factor
MKQPDDCHCAERACSRPLRRALPRQIVVRGKLPVIQHEVVKTQMHLQPGLLELNDAALARLLRDPEQRESARDVLVYRYGSMVRSAAYQYQLPAQHYEDLIQVGYLGLMKAINGFDPAIREDLAPYARACVTGEIKRFFRDKRWPIKVSRTDQELLLGAKKAGAELAAELGATPTEQQVAARLNVSAGALRHAYQAHGAFAPRSLDTPISADDERDAGDLIGSGDPQIEQTADMEAVRQHWNELSGAQREILLLRFYGNMSQSQIAARLHCSQMHVSRLQARALAFLRRRLQTE